MKKQTYIIMSAILLLTPFPILAGEKDVEKAGEKPKTVIVGGHVVRPNVIEYRDKATVHSMILAAGGPTEFGAMKRVKLIRNGKESQLDLTKEKTKNEELAEAGDVIDVPKMDAQE